MVQNSGGTRLALVDQLPTEVVPVRARLRS